MQMISPLHLDMLRGSKSRMALPDPIWAGKVSTRTGNQLMSVPLNGLSFLLTATGFFRGEMLLVTTRGREKGVCLAVKDRLCQLEMLCQFSSGRRKAVNQT